MSNTNIMSNLRIELGNCTDTLLREIADRSCYRRDIAKTYALAMRSSEEVDWPAVNHAIVERWSRSALAFIKQLAWSDRAFGGNTPKPPERELK